MDRAREEGLENFADLLHRLLHSYRRRRWNQWTDVTQFPRLRFRMIVSSQVMDMALNDQVELLGLSR